MRSSQWGEETISAGELQTQTEDAMTYQVRSENRPNAQGLDGAVFVLWNPATNAGAEVWPALGFNCFRWQAVWQGQTLDLLYADPQLFHGSTPTRSGIPVLFPFPNRIAGGQYAWKGKEYQLPCTESSGKNAIHGFAVRKPWRVVDQGADANSAWVTGEFQASVDAPADRPFWPADHRIRLTHRLTNAGLRLEVVVSNPDSVDLPWGLGFHPYFSVPFVSGRSEQDYWVHAETAAWWELTDNLPSAAPEPVDEKHDLRGGRWFAGLTQDDLYTATPAPPGARTNDLVRRGTLRQASNGLGLELWTSPDFRELVLFTPPHRQAVCVEPYTCATDAINLQARGIDAGWQVLAPGAEWRGVVELRAPVATEK